MQILTFILLCSISLSAFAKKSHLTCSKAGTHIAAINGVNISPALWRQFQTSTRDFVQGLVASKVDVKSLTFDSYRNHSFNLLYDSYETWKVFVEQKNRRKSKKISLDVIRKLYLNYITNNFISFNSTCLVANLEKECTKLHEIINFKQTYDDIDNIKKEIFPRLEKGEKIIFLSHSAGAIFTDKVRNHIRENAEHYKMTSHLALARPLISNHERTRNLNFKDDIILLALGLTGDERVPTSNVDNLTYCKMPEGKFDPIISHDYSFCYLGGTDVSGGEAVLDDRKVLPAFEKVRDSLYLVASLLGNNDENCCDKSPNGKVWINGGGFVSDHFIIGENTRIERGAQLCGEGIIINPGFSHIGSNVILMGLIDIDGEFNMNGFKTSPKSEFKLRTRHSPPLSMTDVELDGSLNLKNFMQMDKVKIKGNVEVNHSCGNGCSLSRTRIFNSTLNTPIEEKMVFNTTGTWMSINKTFLNGKVDINGNDNLVFDNVSVKGNTSISNSTGLFAIVNATFEKNLNSSTSDGATIQNATVYGNLNWTAKSAAMNNVIATEDQTIQSDCSVIFDNLKLEASNYFSGGILLIGAKTEKSIVTGTQIFGANCSDPNTSNTFIMAFSDLISFTGYGAKGLYVSGNIGSNVTIKDEVNFYGNNPIRTIASGTTIEGPNILGGCDLSGNIPANYVCPQLR